MTHSRFFTNLGVRNLDLPSANTQLTDASLQDVGRYGYSIGTDHTWIVKDS
jgi:hypothetical protein